jgi:hypothetical protein
LDKSKVKAKGVKMIEKQKTEIQTYFRGLKKRNAREKQAGIKNMQKKKKKDDITN